MSWREERDALIAQTLAFVQSVTGKPADFEQLGAPADPAIASSPPQPSEAMPPVAEPSSSAPTPHTAEAVDAAGYDVMRAEAAMIDAAMRLVANNRRAVPPAMGSGESRSALGPSRASTSDSAEATGSGQPDGAAMEFTGEHFTSITSELGLQRDMQSEIRARVATFRAHQERFNRERQEYFSSTLAKLRASMTDPDSDK